MEVPCCGLCGVAVGAPWIPLNPAHRAGYVRCTTCDAVICATCMPLGLRGFFDRHTVLANSAVSSRRRITSFEGPFGGPLLASGESDAAENDPAAATKLGAPRAAVRSARHDDDEPHPVVDVPGGCPSCQNFPHSSSGSFALFVNDVIPCSRCFAACDPTSAPCRGHSGVHESPVDADGKVVCGTMLYQAPRFSAVVPAPLPARWSCCGAMCHHTTPACPWYRRVVPVLDAHQLSAEGRVAEYEACCDLSRHHEPARAEMLEGLFFQFGTVNNDIPLLVPFSLANQSPTGLRDLVVAADPDPPPPIVLLPGVVRTTATTPGGYQTTTVHPDNPHWRSGGSRGALPYSATSAPVEYPLSKVPFEGSGQPLDLTQHMDDMPGGLVHVFNFPDHWVAIAGAV